MNKDEAEYKLADIRKSVESLEGTNQKILDSLRFQDQDHSAKAGAVMTFSGLMIASSFVQISADSASPFKVPIPNLLLSINCVGLFFLFLSALLALYALMVAGRYSDDTETALAQFKDLITHRRNLIWWSVRLSIMGTLFALVSFYWSIVA